VEIHRTGELFSANRCIGHGLLARRLVPLGQSDSPRRGSRADRSCGRVVVTVFLLIVAQFVRARELYGSRDTAAPEPANELSVVWGSNLGPSGHVWLLRRIDHSMRRSVRWSYCLTSTRSHQSFRLILATTPRVARSGDCRQRRTARNRTRAHQRLYKRSGNRAPRSGRPPLRFTTVRRGPRGSSKRPQFRVARTLIGHCPVERV
jgi:hypothetical protein